MLSWVLFIYLRCHSWNRSHIPLELPELFFYCSFFAAEWSERKNERTRERKKKNIYAFLQPRETNQPNAMLYENRLRCQRVFFSGVNDKMIQESFCKVVKCFFFLCCCCCCCSTSLLFIDWQTRTSHLSDHHLKSEKPRKKTHTINNNTINRTKKQWNAVSERGQKWNLFEIKMQISRFLSISRVLRKCSSEWASVNHQSTEACLTQLMNIKPHKKKRQTNTYTRRIQMEKKHIEWIENEWRWKITPKKSCLELF